MSGSGKAGFAVGLCVGLLVGSRSGRGLYDRSAAAANAVVNDPRVRRGATTAAQRAGEAGNAMAGAAARQVKRVRGGEPDEDERDTRDASMDSGMRHQSWRESRHARAQARAAGARDASSGMGASRPTSAASARPGGMRSTSANGAGGDSMTGRGESGSSAQPRQTGMPGGKNSGPSASDERPD